MRTATFQSVLHKAALLAGIQPSDLLGSDAATLGVGIDRGLRQAWEFAPWPDLCAVLECYYRPEYAAGTAYATGAEVRSAEAYYRAAQPSTGQSVTDTTYWTPLAGLEWQVYVPWATLPEGALPRRCFAENPRVKAWTPELDFSLSAVGIHPIRNVPPSLWIEYRLPCPEWIGAAYSATTAYAAGTTLYWDADFYRITSATTAGETPASAPTKFELLAVPQLFTDYAAHIGLADYFRTSGQLEKAAAEETLSSDILYTKLLQLETQSRQQRTFRP